MLSEQKPRGPKQISPVEYPTHKHNFKMSGSVVKEIRNNGGLIDALLRTNLSDVVNLPETTTSFAPILAPLNSGVEPTIGPMMINSTDGGFSDATTAGPNGKEINSFYFYKVSGRLNKRTSLLHPGSLT